MNCTLIQKYGVFRYVKRISSLKCLLTVMEIKHTLHQNKYIMELNIVTFDNQFIEAPVIYFKFHINYFHLFFQI